MSSPIARISLLAAAGLLAIAAPAAADDFSYIKKGTYAGTGRLPAFSGNNEQGVNQQFPASTFPISFKVTSTKRKGPRYARSLKLGPVLLTCTNTTSVPTRYKQLPVPALSLPPVSIPNGFFIRTFVRRGTKWKPGKSAVPYTGPLPHLDIGLVFQRPSKFTPNPLSSPSVTYKVRVDDQNRQTTSGAWNCAMGLPITFRKR